MYTREGEVTGTPCGYNHPHLQSPPSNPPSRPHFHPLDHTFTLQTTLSPYRPHLHPTDYTFTLQTTPSPYRLHLHPTDHTFTLQTTPSPSRPHFHPTAPTLKYTVHSPSPILTSPIMSHAIQQYIYSLRVWHAESMANWTYSKYSRQTGPHTSSIQVGNHVRFNIPRGYVMYIVSSGSDRGHEKTQGHEDRIAGGQWTVTRGQTKSHNLFE